MGGAGTDVAIGIIKHDDHIFPVAQPGFGQGLQRAPGLGDLDHHPAVFVGDVAQSVADQVDDAQLRLRAGIDHLDGLGKPIRPSI